MAKTWHYLGGLILNKGFQLINIGQLVKADWNYKTNDDVLLQKLAANIKRNGQIENILVRELETGFFEIVNGNHRYDALLQLGIQEIMAFNLGNVTHTQAKRIAIETNETVFKADHVRLAELIGEIIQDFDISELIETMPYSQEDLDSFTNLLNFDWNQFEDNITTEPQSNVPPPAPLTCPCCSKGLKLSNNKLIEL